MFSALLPKHNAVLAVTLLFFEQFLEQAANYSYPLAESEAAAKKKNGDMLEDEVIWLQHWIGVNDSDCVMHET
jgi:hypothetical protein